MLFLFLLSCLNSYASQYHQSVLVPAYKTVDEWNVPSPVSQVIGSNVDINLFVEDNDLLCSQRLSLASPGYMPTPIVSYESLMPASLAPVAQLVSLYQNREFIFPQLTKKFDKLRTANTNYCGDYILCDQPCSGASLGQGIRSLSFGYAGEAFRMVLMLDRLYKNGVREINIDVEKFGFAPVLNALTVLGHPAEYPGAEKFCALAGIDRIDREHILDMIQGLILDDPVKDPVELVTNLLCNKITEGMKKGLKQYGPKNDVLSYGFETALKTAFVKAIPRELNVADIDKTCSRVLFNNTVNFLRFDNPYPVADEMLTKIEHYKKDYPRMSLLYFGSSAKMFGIHKDHKSLLLKFPVNEKSKYYLPVDNTVFTQDLRFAIKQAFLRKINGSYYKINSVLKLGDMLLHNMDNNTKFNGLEYSVGLRLASGMNQSDILNELSSINIASIVNTLQKSIKKYKSNLQEHSDTDSDLTYFHASL